MQKAVKKSVYIRPSLNESALKYLASKQQDNKKYSYSDMVNEALEKLFDIEATNRSLNMSTQIINKSIQTEMKKFDNRISDMVVRNLITTYTIEELLARLILLTYGNTVSDEKTFLKELLADSRATSVQILKNTPKEEIKKILDKLL